MCSFKFSDNDYVEFTIGKRQEDDYLFINFVSKNMGVSVIMYCDMEKDEVFTSLRSNVRYKTIEDDYIIDSINIKKLSTLNKLVNPIIAICATPGEVAKLTAKNLEPIHSSIISKCNECYVKLLPKML